MSPPELDLPTLQRLAQSAAIAVAALAVFLGLRGRILQFAQWAGLPRLAFGPVRLVLRYSILMAALLVILGLWGFELGTVAAVLGTVLGLVAIGFVAVWSVLSNFLCTFVLVAFKPFSVGDELELPAEKVKGRVVDLTLIFTTLRVAPGETVLIPNNTFFQRIFTRREGRHTASLSDQLRQPDPATPPSEIP